MNTSKSKRIIAIALGALMAALIALAGCSGGSTGGTTTSKSSTSEKSSASAESSASAASSSVTASSAAADFFGQASSSSTSKSAADQSRDGWYTTRLYLQSRDGAPVPDNAKNRWSQITFDGKTMTVNGFLSHGSSKEAAEKASSAEDKAPGVNSFAVSDFCKFTTNPSIESSNAQPISTDYEGFKNGLYNRAMDIKDAMVTFHVLNGEVVEATQWTKAVG